MIAKKQQRQAVFEHYTDFLNKNSLSDDYSYLQTDKRNMLYTLAIENPQLCLQKKYLPRFTKSLPLSSSR
jgi:hypothetical protein